MNINKPTQAKLERIETTEVGTSAEPGMMLKQRIGIWTKKEKITCSVADSATSEI